LLFPHKQSGSTSYELYEDDGISANYQENHTIVSVQMNADSETINVTCKIEGEYKLPYDSLCFYLPENEQRKLFVNGQEITKENNRYSVAL
jgi:alpha-glucosidase